MNTYTPSSLRSSAILPRKECWGVGIEKTPNEFRMTNGPFSTESEALETVGDRKSRIIHFLADGSSEVVWWWAGDCWIQREEIKKLKNNDTY